MSTPIYTKTYVHNNTANVTIPMGSNGSSSSGLYTIAISGGGGGGSGGVIYNSSSTNWASTSTTTGKIKPASIQVQGDAEFSGNITWQGRDMREWFATVESRLSMLQPNPELEEDYDKLKDLGDQYRALEKKLLEQQRTFDILKKPLD